MDPSVVCSPTNFKQNMKVASKRLITRVEVAMTCMRRGRKIVVAVNLGKPCEIDGRFRPAC